MLTIRDKHFDHVAAVDSFTELRQFVFCAHRVTWFFVGSGLSGFTPRSRIALVTNSRFKRPRFASASSDAITIDSASTSKKRRNAARESLRPNPSVPSVV